MRSRYIWCGRKDRVMIVNYSGQNRKRNSLIAVSHHASLKRLTSNLAAMELSSLKYLIFVYAAYFIALHTVVKHLLLKHIRHMHPELWEKMGNPGTFSTKDSHWNLTGFSADFDIYEFIGTDPTGQQTRKQVHRYRVLSVIDVVFLVASVALVFIVR